MKKDTTLLQLEKKLENNTEKDIVLSKFNFSKPNIKMDFSTKINKEGLMDFLNQMKKSNEELMKNPNKYNVEQDDGEEDEPKIELDLAMGILEDKQQKEIVPQDIIDSQNNKEPELTKGEKELVNFIIDITPSFPFLFVKNSSSSKKSYSSSFIFINAATSFLIFS